MRLRIVVPLVGLGMSALNVSVSKNFARPFKGCLEKFRTNSVSSLKETQLVAEANAPGKRKSRSETLKGSNSGAEVQPLSAPLQGADLDLHFPGACPWLPLPYAAPSALVECDICQLINVANHCIVRCEDTNY